MVKIIYRLNELGLLLRAIKIAKTPFLLVNVFYAFEHDEAVITHCKNDYLEILEIVAGVRVWHSAFITLIQFADNEGKTA